MREETRRGHSKPRKGSGRSLAPAVLLACWATLSGCMFHIDHSVPHHANVGDRIALRNPEGSELFPAPLQVLFENAMTREIIRHTAQEIVVEVPPGLEGRIGVSVWLRSLPVSNIIPFQVDSVPIVHRILAYGDSLVGPWAYHAQMLDIMLNEDIGPSLVINEGKAGETVSEGAQRLAEVLATHNSIQYIYILEGANDVSDERNTPLGEMVAAVDTMMDQAAALSLYPILLTVPPRTRNALLYDRTWPTTEDWNEALRDYAVYNGIEWVDLYELFVTQPGWESFLEQDGLHLSGQGQAFVAEVLYATIAPLLE